MCLHSSLSHTCSVNLHSLLSSRESSPTSGSGFIRPLLHTGYCRNPSGIPVDEIHLFRSRRWAFFKMKNLNISAYF